MIGVIVLMCHLCGVISQITVFVSAGCEAKDYGNLTFEEFPDDEPVGQVKNARAVGSANQRLSEAVKAVKKDGHTTVMLGGDHR